MLDISREALAAAEAYRIESMQYSNSISMEAKVCAGWSWSLVMGYFSWLRRLAL
jgi:hypothetical protein